MSQKNSLPLCKKRCPLWIPPAQLGMRHRLIRLMNLYRLVGLYGPRFHVPHFLGCLHTIYVTHACLPPQSLSRSMEGYIGVAPDRPTCFHLSIICITVMLSQQTSLASPYLVPNFTTPSLLRMRFTSDSLSPQSLYLISLSWTLWKGT